MHAQNFKPVPIKVEAYYQPTHPVSTQEKPLISYRIDSSLTIANANDTTNIIYPNHVVGKRQANNCAYTTTDTSWLGKKVIINDQQPLISRFINKDDDTITIRHLAPEGQSWKVLEMDTGSYIRANVDSQKWMPHLGRAFNTRFISFQAFNNQGNKIPHIVNGVSIQNTFSFGLIKTVDFNEFPDDSTTYKLAGITKFPPPSFQPSFDTINPKAMDFLNFEIGNEFHYKITKESVDGAIANKTVIHEKRMVIDKSMNGTPTDSLSYKFFRTRRQIKPTNSSDTVLLTDTLEKQYSLKNYFFLNKMSNEFIKNGQHGEGYMNTYLTSDYNGRFVKEPRDYFSYDSTTNCLDDSLTPTPQHIYATGLGKVFAKDIRPDSTKEILTRELVYFQKGLETWGTPYNFDKLVGLPREDTTFDEVKIFPNPFKTQFTVKWGTLEGWSNKSLKVKLYNMHGRQIMTESIQTGTGSDNQITLSIDEQPTGIYLLQFSSSTEEHVLTKKIIKR